MLLPNPHPRRFLKILAGLLISLALTGCFRPMLAERSDGSSVTADLSQIYIGTIGGRVGQKVRNDLIYAFGTSSGGAGALYQLSIDLSVTVQGTLIQPNTRARGKTTLLNATYTLTESETGEIVHGGTAFSRASYDASTALFANERAEIDAENRAAGVLAENIKTRVSAWIAANPRSGSTAQY